MKTWRTLFSWYFFGFEELLTVWGLTQLGEFREFYYFTAWKVFKYGVISGPYLVNLCTGKYGPEITPYMDTFHAVFKSKKIEENSFS